MCLGVLYCELHLVWGLQYDVFSGLLHCLASWLWYIIMVYLYALCILLRLWIERLLRMLETSTTSSSHVRAPKASIRLLNSIIEVLFIWHLILEVFKVLVVHFDFIIDQFNIDWVLFVARQLSIILAHLLGVASFLLTVKEGAYL